LSEAILPTGSRLEIGPEVVIEFSDLPHTGCTKFEARYGQDARTFINNPRREQLHLRGRFARIITPGTITVSDAIRKL
jgi:MOSC domain-containing protein YiiM